MTRATDVATIAAHLAARTRPERLLIVGVTGSVAVGKSTFSADLARVLARGFTVEVIATDGFLYPNAHLTERGLLMRKGYPETFDADALLAAIGDVRQGPATFPGYSHTAYDIDPALARRVEPPDILILEGLGLSAFTDGRSAANLLDLLIYLDADEADIEAWFVARFVEFWRAAEHAPGSFYAQFRSMNEEQVAAFAGRVWTGVNLPNLRENIVTARDAAHIVLKKSLDHSLSVVRD
jgi:type I pantothenate kinase